MHVISNSKLHYFLLPLSIILFFFLVEWYLWLVNYKRERGCWCILEHVKERRPTFSLGIIISYIAGGWRDATESKGTEGFNS